MAFACRLVSLTGPLAPARLLDAIAIEVGDCGREGGVGDVFVLPVDV